MHPLLPVAAVGALAFAATPALRTAAWNIGLKAGTTALKYGVKGSWWGLKAGAGVISREGPGLASMASKTLNFAVRHPYMVAGGIGAYAALEAAPTFESPTKEGYHMRSSFNQESIAVENLQSGVLPTGNMTPGAAIRNQRFAQSAFGITQGLWASRH